MKNYIFYLLIIFCYMSDALAELTVCSSIRPLYGLVENITKDINSSKLLVSKPNSSPHNYSLSPSELKLLSKCDVIFLINKDLEYFLPKAIKAVGKKNLEVVELANDPSIRLLKARQNGDHKDSHQNDINNSNHHHGENDLHIWLNPENANIILKIVTNKLIKLDSDNLDKYIANHQIAQEKIEKLDSELKLQLEPYKNSPYLVFHDAYQYFDTYYGLNYFGEFSSAGHTISAQKLVILQDIIVKNNIKCIFAEPEFSDHVIKKISTNHKIKTGILDAEWGDNNAKGENIYFNLMHKLANNFVKCMSND